VCDREEVVIESEFCKQDGYLYLLRHIQKCAILTSPHLAKWHHFIQNIIVKMRKTNE